MRITLTRQHVQPASCTLGELRVAGVRLWSLERPWVPCSTCEGGTRGISCVPAGLYKLERHASEAHPRSFALVNPVLGVSHYDSPGMRSLVLIHVANRVEELRGCIALGRERREGPPGTWTLVESRTAIQQFNATVPWSDGHELEVLQA